MTTPARRRAGASVRWALRRLGYRLVNDRASGPAARPLPPDLDDFTVSVIEAVDEATLTSPERIAALVESVRHLVRTDVPGALVECGVWRGGSMMAAAMTLLDLGVDDRDLHLFDTFTHMPEPGEEDWAHTGEHASEILEQVRDSEAFRYLDFDGVRRNLLGTGYPEDRIHFVPGMVEDTIPGAAPDRIAFCRLDTDWYASTRHELEHLWPRISPGGVLLVDDYGHFLGCRQAVDEHLRAHGPDLFLHRIDYSGRLVVKPATGPGQTRTQPDPST